MDWRVMDARLDFGLCEATLEFDPSALLRQDDDGEMVCGLALAVATEGHFDARSAVKGRSVLGNESRDRSVLLLEAANLVEPVVESRYEDVVTVRVATVAVPRQLCHSVRPEQPDPVGQRFAVRYDHPAFTDWQVLVRKEAETADVAERPAHSSSPACTGCVRRILDYGDAVLRRKLNDLVHCARMAAVVQHDDGSRGRRDRGFDTAHIEVQVVRALDVAKDRRRTHMDDRVRGGDEVQGRNDDLVARGAADCEQRQV